MKPLQQLIKEATGNPDVFWISPDNDIYSVSNHTDGVIDNPERYGFTLSELKTIYKQHNEPFGEYAGVANTIILKILLNKGWVRIRCKWNLDICLISLGRHFINNVGTLSSINQFAKEYLNHSTDVTINAFGGNTPITYTGKEVKSRMFLESVYKVKLNSVVLKG